MSKLTGEVIYKNNHVANIYEACTCCYDNTKPLTYLEKKEYIRKRVEAGHESILEHGRLTIKIKGISVHDSIDIAELTTLEYSKYLEFYSVTTEYNEIILIINGSMRAYKHFMTNTTHWDYSTSPIIRLIHSLLMDNTVGELYGKEFEMYDDENPARFVDIEFFNYEATSPELYTRNINGKTTGIQYDTVIADKTIDIATANTRGPVKKVDIGIDTSYIDSLINDPDISSEVFFNILAITVLFKNMSRTATHQLVRHRNAITQESQRYVTAKNATFTIPTPLYDDNERHPIELFGQTKEVNLSELAIELMSVYEQLIDAGLKKEEARAFLPSNVNCGRLYMTFSFANLLAFLKLRTDPHAQYEIRTYAESIKNALIVTLSMFGLQLNVDEGYIF